MAVVRSVPRVAIARYVKHSTPAAGAAVVIKVAGGSQILPVTLIATLTTSAVVGNRFPQVTLKDQDGLTYIIAGAAVAHTATTVTVVTATTGVDSGVSFVGGVTVIPFATPPMPPGFTITLGANGLLGGDTLTAVYMTYYEYIDGTDAYTGFPSYEVGPT